MQTPNTSMQAHFLISVILHYPLETYLFEATKYYKLIEIPLPNNCEPNSSTPQYTVSTTVVHG